MRFEWDESKNRRNRAKHGVSFETATQVFQDPAGVIRFDRTVGREERWHLIGSTFANSIILVVHMLETGNDDELVRIISARRANTREKETYQRGS